MYSNNKIIIIFKKMLSVLIITVILSIIFILSGCSEYKKGVAANTQQVISSTTKVTIPPSPTPSITIKESNNSTIEAEKTDSSIKDNYTPTPIPFQLVMPPVTNECMPENFKGFTYSIIYDGKTFNKEVPFKRNEIVDFPDAEKYNSTEGITTFRGNNFRNSPSFGFADIKEEKLEKVWFSTTGYIDIWTGVGWNGQPSIVKWDEDIKNIMNIGQEKKSKTDLKEVIYATLDGKIYFLDLDDGKPTRETINAGYSHKGSVAVDPRGYPILYAGQGIPEKNGVTVPIGHRIYSLINQELLCFIDGMDKNAYRGWGAFDSVPLVDPVTDTLFLLGENGIFYNVKLNTDFDINKATLSINPEIIKYRYKSPYGTKIGMENSPVIFRNMIYFADNSGLLQCLNLDTLEPIWLRNISDDTDSTMLLETKAPSEVSLYTACELDLQGAGGFSYIRKINALSGELIWEKNIKCYYDSHTNGGALASPISGKYDIENLVIYNIAKTGSNNNGSTLIALDRTTGEEKWKNVLDYYCWSSPIDIYTSEGKSYIIACDSGGYMRLFEGTTGEQLDCISLEANVEGSPAAYNDMIVVGTRGQKIWGIKIK